MLAGYIWLMHNNVQSYAIGCSAIAISALVLTVLFVKDPPLPPPTANIKRKEIDLSSPTASAHRPRQALVMLLKPVSELSTSKLYSSISKKEFLFFAGTGLFFVSGNLLYTPYTPFLKDSGISDSEVFLAYTILHLSKVIFLPFNHTIVARMGEELMGRLAYIPRISGIALAVTSAFLFAANPTSILMVSIVAFVASEIGYSIWSTTTTSSLLKIIPHGKEGSILGINSAVTGAGLLTGSIAAGEVAAIFGYGVTFVLSIGFMVASFTLVGKYFQKTAVVRAAKASST